LADSLYQSLVVERARRPLRGGTLETADGSGDGSNPLCGDRVHVALRLGTDGTVAAVRHRSRACAICAASSDLMAESVEGLGPEEARGLHGLFARMMETGVDALDEESRARLGLLLAFSDLHEYRSRRKCAALPWSALDVALGAALAGTAGAPPGRAMIDSMQGEGHEG